MEMFDPRGMKPPSDYRAVHPLDGYGRQMLAGYGEEPELEPYRTEKLQVANMRSRLSERR
jgi:hypothetical protein